MQFSFAEAADQHGQQTIYIVRCRREVVEVTHRARNDLVHNKCATASERETISLLERSDHPGYSLLQLAQHSMWMDR